MPLVLFPKEEKLVCPTRDISVSQSWAVSRW